MPAAAACLPLVPLCYTTPAASTIATTSSITPTRNSSHNYLHKAPALMLNRGRRRVACYSSSSSNSSNIADLDFDLYDLMGIDSSCDRSEIKTAYRTLQKRCHPDIAGPAGHDMAIILNEAYALLSDPNSRSAYDKEHEKIAQLRGYSGKPIYSVWFGTESEERAVFVDEVKCIGCLKCALCAEKTFAIESVYGRARVVGQWADPESKIQEAIQACPVDCISVVERSDLAALEFLMSKQPRGNVRIGMGNAAGARVSNIFVDVKKFQTRFQDAKERASAQSNETDLQREARMSAMQAIRSISNLLYWKTPFSSASDQSMSLQHVTKSIGNKSEDPTIRKLRDAAAARKQARDHGRSTRPNRQLSNMMHKEQDYWTPSDALPAAASAQNNNSKASIFSNSSISESSPSPAEKWNHDNIKYQRKPSPNPIRWLAPVGPALMMAAITSRLQLQGEGAVGNGGLKEHIYGSVALEIVNSSWLQIILVAITWYIIGTVLVGVADAIKSRRS